MRRILAVLVVCFGGASLFAQTPSAERQIRDLIAKYDTDHDASVFDKDAVIWTGAYAKPQRLSPNPADSLAMPGRKNVVQKTDVQEIVVAKSGDMAYENSTFTLAYDDDSGHKERTGAILRVWRQIGSEWKIVSMYQRPYGRVVPVETPAK
jgi:Domain of unknown function (DUF4440)